MAGAVELSRGVGRRASGRGPHADRGGVPGRRGSLFEALRAPVDLLVTGELRHHDILAHVAAGTTVVVTDHTNTERGYLPRFAAQLRAAMPEVVVTVSTVDADPLQPV